MNEGVVSKETVVLITIPENLPLTDSEKSVLSKGLNFVPITKRTNEFTIKVHLTPKYFFR